MAVMAESVSVIIPAYNGEKYLAAAIQSVLAQTLPAAELLVVDDGSTDRSAEIAQSFSDVDYIAQENAGVAAARNRGLAAATGELVAFLDQDDLWCPAKLERQLALMQAEPQLDYCLCWARYRVEPGVDLPRFLTEESVKEEALSVMPGTLLVWRRAFEKTGFFDTRYQVSSDLDWFFRANDAGLKRGELKETLVTRRIHASNCSRDAELMERERLQIMQRSIARRRAAR